LAAYKRCAIKNTDAAAVVEYNSGDAREELLNVNSFENNTISTLIYDKSYDLMIIIIIERNFKFPSCCNVRIT